MPSEFSSSSDGVAGTNPLIAPCRCIRREERNLDGDEDGLENWPDPDEWDDDSEAEEERFDPEPMDDEVWDDFEFDDESADDEPPPEELWNDADWE